MASVAAKFTFSCPHCDKVLKTGARPAAGKKIKCPACGEPFVPDLDDADESSIQEKPTLKGKSKAGSKTNLNGKVRPTPKKAPEKSGGSGMLLGVLGCGALVLLLGCGGGAFGVTGWLWPGFMLSKKADETKLAGAKDDSPKEGNKDNKPAAAVVGDKNDFAVYCPAETTVVLGMNSKALRQANQLDKVLGGAESLSKNGKKMPKGLTDLFRKSDRITTASVPGMIDSRSKDVSTVLMPSADLVAEFKKLSALGAEQKIGAKQHAVFRPTPAFGEQWPLLVTFPADRLIVFGDLSDAEMAAVLDRALAKDTPPNPVIDLCRVVEQSHVYGACYFDKNIHASFDNLISIYVQLNPNLSGMKDAMQRAKGGHLAVNNVNATSWQFKIGVECADMPDAQKMKSGAEIFVPLYITNTQKGTFGLFPPSSVVREARDLKYESTGAVAYGSVVLSNQAIGDFFDTLVKLGGDEPPPVKDKEPPPVKDKGFPPVKDKEFPPVKDKDPPKSKLISPPGPQSPQFYVFGLNEGSADERGIQLKKGQRIMVQVTNNTATKKLPRNNVDFYIYRGDGDNKNLIKADEKPLDKERASHISNFGFDVPNVGDAYQTYYIRVVNKGPGRSSQIIGSFEDWTGKDFPATTPAKEKDPPKINPNAKQPPAQYPLGNMPNGRSDTKLFVFQPGKMVRVDVAFGVLAKQRADVEITIYKGEKGNDVVVTRRGFGSFAVQFTPAGDTEAVYRVHIHNRGPNTAQNCGVQVAQQK